MLVSHPDASRSPRAHEPTAHAVVLATGETLRVSNGSFAATTTDGLQPAMLAALADGSVPALRMTDAVDPAWCDYVSERFAQHPATTREGVTPPIYSLGSHLYSWPKGQTAAYFRDIEACNAAIASVLPDGHDPITAFLRDACAMSQATLEYLASDGASVRHGALRRWGDGSRASQAGPCYFAVPHEDYAETHADHGHLEQIRNADNVFSIILCIDAVADQEPETILWDRRLTLEEIRDPGNRHPWASYGYNEALLEGVAALSLRLKKGDAAIIPAHNLHCVVGFPGFRRCSYMAFFHFIGRRPGGFDKLIFRT